MNSYETRIAHSLRCSVNPYDFSPHDDSICFYEIAGTVEPFVQIEIHDMLLIQ